MVFLHFLVHKVNQTVSEGQNPLVHHIVEAGMAEYKMFAILCKVLKD
jgi:hypothetical protein